MVSQQKKHMMEPVMECQVAIVGKFETKMDAQHE
jgi:hypothetical protein